MRLRSLTTHIMRTTAIALPLLGAPLTVKMVDHGLKVTPAQAWAESDHGDSGGHDSGGDHGGSSGGSDHSSSSDHSSGGGGGDDHGSSSDGSHKGSQDQSQDQSRSQEQDRLAQDRDSWLGVSDQGQSSSAQTSSGGVLVPVPEDQERQLIERGWTADDAQGDHR
jgi:hypothetical protein